MIRTLLILMFVVTESVQTTLQAISKSF